MGQEAPEKDPRAMPEEPAQRAGVSTAAPRSWATSGVAERKALPYQARGSAPQFEWTPEQSRIVEELYAKALLGELPRSRPLKYWEPEKLNERHLAMIMMRVGGVHQRIIAKAFGCSDAHVSVVLNHPDSEYLLSRLMALRAADPGDIIRRLEELSGPAMSTLEDVFLSDDPETVKVAMRKAPLAFKVFEAAGKVAPKKTENTNTQNLNLKVDATPAQLEGISRALRDLKALKDPEYVTVSSEEGLKELLNSPVGGDFVEDEGGDASQAGPASESWDRSGVSALPPTSNLEGEGAE